MMLAVNGLGPEWTSVISGGSQGSALASLLFNVFINEEAIESTLSKCVDVTKLSAAVYTPKRSGCHLKDRMPEGPGQYQEVKV